MRILRTLILVVLVLGVLLFVFLEPIRRAAVVYLSLDYEAAGAPAAGARFDGVDARFARLEVKLDEVADGFSQPTELAFAPGEHRLLWVAEKKGALRWVDLAQGSRGTLLELPVLSRSEQGLLGFAFHPGFTENRRLFVNYVARRGDHDGTVVQEFRVPQGTPLRSATLEPGPVVVEVEQPYANHNGGQLLFGPDGALYVPLGDGGLKDDPRRNGQDISSLLGAILRFDVSGPAASPAHDNPFVGHPPGRPEIWAFGVRNPWRSAFDPRGRLIVADVGQDTWEEVGFAGIGESLGWNVWEGQRCFPPGSTCGEGRHRAPFWAVEHPVALSITGGLVYQGTELPELRGRFLAADFVTGRFWALPVPESDAPVQDKEVLSLGAWDWHPVSFTADTNGEVYVADFGRGTILRLSEP